MVSAILNDDYDQHDKTEPIFFPFKAQKQSLIKGVAYVEATEAAASVKNKCKKKKRRQLNSISMFSIKGQ